MRVLAVSALSLLVMAAAPPQRGFVVAVPDVSGYGLGGRAPTLAPPTSGLQPAPLPNRDVEGPAQGRAGTETRVSPTVLQRSDTYRGEGFSRGSTAQAEQERRAKPGAGFNVKVPFAPN